MRKALQQWGAEPKDLAEEANAAPRLDQIEENKVTVMLERLNAFPAQIRDAWRLGADSPLGQRRPRGIPRRVVICGMGGSGNGAHLIQRYGETHCAVPIQKASGYHLPAGLTKDSLVVAVSYSGNTAETRSCYEEAAERGIPRAVICGGGDLRRRARQLGDTLVLLPDGLQPREALAYLTVPIFLLLARFGLWQTDTRQLLELLEATNEVVYRCNPFVPFAENPAKKLAAAACRRLPIVLGTEGCPEAAAGRWRAMLNENAKLPALSDSLAEFCHNGIETLNHEQQLFLLRSMTEAPAQKRQIAALEKVAAERGAGCQTVWVMGKNCLAKGLAFMALGDYCSLYAACLRRADCDRIPSISRLKTLVEKENLCYNKR